MHWTRRLILIGIALFIGGCATKKDIVRIEEKIDMIVLATKRATLDEIFGPQAAQIRQRIDQLSEEERQRYETLLSEYQHGKGDIGAVREKLVQILGGGTRVVSTRSGLYVRNLLGDRHSRAVPRGTRLEDCERLSETDLPELILENQKLRQYQWGRGQLEGEPVLFAWDFTLSEFAKEIVESTAARTAEEFIRMGGGRPVHIQIVSEHPETLEVYSPDSHQIKIRETRDEF